MSVGTAKKPQLQLATSPPAHTVHIVEWEWRPIHVRSVTIIWWPGPFFYLSDNSDAIEASFPVPQFRVMGRVCRRRPWLREAGTILCPLGLNTMLMFTIDVAEKPLLDTLSRHG